MVFCDTHTHLYANEFDADRDETVKRAVVAGIELFLLPNIDGKSIGTMKSLAEKYPKNCFPMMGIHPCSIKNDYKQLLELAEKELFGSYKYYGVGEVGLDLYWDKTFFEAQKDAFTTQVKWAIKLNLPLSIHTREATNEAIQILQQPALQGARGVFHCFGGSDVQARQIIELGFHLGIGGVLTFKNTTLANVLQNIDLKHIVFETDSPYLAPMPFRGKRNESAYILHIAEKLAAVKNISLAQVAAITTQNAKAIFAI